MVSTANPALADWKLEIPGGAGSVSPALGVSTRNGRSLALAGSVENIEHLRRGHARTAGDADLLLTAFETEGEALLPGLRGAFALIVWNHYTGERLLVRDPMGRYPLFYAERGSTLFASCSVDLLRRQPGISRALNGSLLAESFCGQWTSLEETFYAAIRRVPPGSAVRLTETGRTIFRYWNPGPEANGWATPDEVREFEPRLEAAVAKPLSAGPAAIFLSGGLDSVAIAAVAAGQCRSHGDPLPRALSLVFPDVAVNEEPVQRGVASQLGLRQELIPFDKALDGRSLALEALELSREMAQPLDNIWLPAYRCLFERARQLGCASVLTGTGGDEWLGMSPLLSADLIRSRDWAGYRLLWNALVRSNGRGMGFAIRRNLLWKFGVRPLVRQWAVRTAASAAPGLLERKRERRVLASIPEWAAPDPSMRRRIVERTLGAEDRRECGASFYLGDLRESLDHPLVSVEAEEHFESGRLFGVPLAHPFLDANLVDLLYRVSPRDLLAGGRTKGLVRQTLASRFPDLGFERQRKVDARHFAAERIFRDVPEALRRLGGIRTLEAAGVVDGARARDFLLRAVESRNEAAAWRVWMILNFECWARANS